MRALSRMTTTQLEEMRRLLIKYDPLLAIGNPKHQQDEYDLEIPMVARATMDCRDYKSLRSELRRIFAKTGGVIGAGTVFRYTKLAKELIRLNTEAVGSR